MTKYTVKVPVLLYRTYTIDAASPADAINRLLTSDVQTAEACYLGEESDGQVMPPEKSRWRVRRAKRG